MGYGLSAFLMEKPEHALIFGCRDGELLDEVLAVLEERLADYDEQADVREEGRIPHAEALKEIFAGNLSRPECASIYGWAYELYCASMGERLNVNPFVPCRSAWYQTLDGFLEHQSVPLRFEKLISDCPIPLPPPDDWPCIGHWTHRDIVAGQQSIAGWVDCPGDPSIREALAVVSDWFTRALSMPQSLIIGFHG